MSTIHVNIIKVIVVSIMITTFTTMDMILNMNNIFCICLFSDYRAADTRTGLVIDQIALSYLK